MVKYISAVPGAPKAVGPYSVATEANGFVFLSGQIPLDPESGQLVSGGIEQQTDRVLQNISTVLEHPGLSFANATKTTIFLTDLAHFKTVNGIYEKWLGDNKPARSTIQVAALPLGAIVEIEMIAAKG